MSDSQYHVNLHILSRILTRLFTKKVSVTGFNRDHYEGHVVDGYIDIRFDSFLATEQELFYKVLRIIRQTLAQGRFVVGSVFGHANLEDGGENYILSENISDSPVKEVTDDNPPFEWSEVSNDKLPFEWTCCLPEDGSEDSLRFAEGYDDDGSIVAVFTLKYSIAMDRKACFDDDAAAHTAHLDQLSKDIESLCGKNTHQAYNLFGSLQELDKVVPYEIDLFGPGQDIFISSSIVRAFKEKEDLCTDLL